MDEPVSSRRSTYKDLKYKKSPCRILWQYILKPYQNYHVDGQTQLKLTQRGMEDLIRILVNAFKLTQTRL